MLDQQKLDQERSLRALATGELCLLLVVRLVLELLP
jgi:hypothetical protein